MTEDRPAYDCIPGAVELVATGEPPIRLKATKLARGFSWEASVRAATVEEADALLAQAMALLAQRYGGEGA